VNVRHERADSAASAVVVQPLGESLGLAQALQGLPDFRELGQHRSQLEADVDEGQLQCRLALRQRLEGAERLLEPGLGVRER
jgi:AmiR/NasT family two-component response regulator